MNKFSAKLIPMIIWYVIITYLTPWFCSLVFFFFSYAYKVAFTTSPVVLYALSLVLSFPFSSDLANFYEVFPPLKKQCSLSWFLTASLSRHDGGLILCSKPRIQVETRQQVGFRFNLHRESQSLTQVTDVEVEVVSLRLGRFARYKNQPKDCKIYTHVHT